jgi:molybdopterin synthase sulfur carrier subunit
MVHVQLKLFASLGRVAPGNADRYPIEPGTTIGQIVDRLKIPRSQARLVFVDNVKADLERTLSGGERVGIFPPVGGG